MKAFGFSALVLLLLVVSATGQKTDSVRCVVSLYDLRGDEWKLRRSVDFVPKMQEEQLTNKVVRLPHTGLVLFASVFPTDESMHSAKGADSLKLGLALSRQRHTNAFDLSNNAVAEGTLSNMDTLRVERTANVSGKPLLTRLECWDPNLEKDKMIRTKTFKARNLPVTRRIDQ